MKRRCANPNCSTPFYEPDAAHRFGDCCSKACAREMTTHKHHVVMQTSNFMSDQHRERPTPNRVHGRDNRE